MIVGIREELKRRKWGGFSQNMLYACIRTSSTKNVNKQKRKCIKVEIIMLKTGMTSLLHM